MPFPPAKIVILEDDDFWASDIEAALREEFGHALTVVRIAREFDFIQQFPEFIASPPDAFILDVRVIWTYMRPDMQLPNEDQSDRSKAGLRCKKMIDESLPGKPVFFVSILSKEDLHKKMGDGGPPLANHFLKDEEIASMVQALKTALITGR